MFICTGFVTLVQGGVTALLVWIVVHFLEEYAFYNVQAASVCQDTQIIVTESELGFASARSDVRALAVTVPVAVYVYDGTLDAWSYEDEPQTRDRAMTIHEERATMDHCCIRRSCFGALPACTDTAWECAFTNNGCDAYSRCTYLAHFREAPYKCFAAEGFGVRDEPTEYPYAWLVALIATSLGELLCSMCNCSCLLCGLCEAGAETAFHCCVFFFLHTRCICRLFLPARRCIHCCFLFPS